ncbi:AraC family transcriptional regulator [Flavobacteriaceae bacterium F08102]|nr:AraC family transcriptional regulator [Flavobacteriaceae bacterium F08102]
MSDVENNNGQGVVEIGIETNFKVLKISNLKNTSFSYKKEITSSFIQFHFCLEGSARLQFGPHYGIDVSPEKSLLLYNPNQHLPMDLTLGAHSKFITLIVGIEIFHSFFTQVSGLLPFLSEENKNNKYYADKALSPNELVVLNQMYNEQMHTSLEVLYTRAKVYELLSLYFNQTDDQGQHCPFLNNEKNVEKIRLAKKIVIENLAEPPGLQELADQVGLSLAKLKEGFKHIYGDSVFNFLLDYKLEYARKLLLEENQNVSEISLQVGYSTASHFIAAFKKKFGTTPKQYVMSVMS